MSEAGDDLLAKVQAARAAVAASEGAKLRGELSALSRTYRIFTTNERELRAFFHRYTDDIKSLLELWDISHPHRFEAFLDETDRLLHNYVAAAGSLADHTMRL